MEQIDEIIRRQWSIVDSMYEMQRQIDILFIILILAAFSILYILQIYMAKRNRMKSCIALSIINTIFSYFRLLPLYITIRRLSIVIPPYEIRSSEEYSLWLMENPGFTVTGVDLAVLMAIIILILSLPSLFLLIKRKKDKQNKSPLQREISP